LALGRAGVLFSATLSPVDYFIQTLGGGTQAKRIGVESPFPQEHLCLLVADTISTKYADRANTARDVCRYIEAAVRAKQGNYMVFFSSYQYLREIQEQFQTLYPHIQLAVQNAGLTEEERTAFLQQFSTQNSDTLLGFCVLGGVFSEGVDLTGDRLIGSIIVGVGLPQIGTERDALRQYYQTLNGEGFSYAYQYPGMNKVLQAAGRVIRTPQDKGMVLLIDDRYAQASYRRLFPPHWSHAQTVSSPEDMSDKLQKFWNF
jgi:Rad3-related DNA helicase